MTRITCKTKSEFRQDEQNIFVTNLTLHNDYAALAVHTNPSRMLQNIRSELANKLAVLVVDLDLVRWAPEQRPSFVKKNEAFYNYIIVQSFSSGTTEFF